MGSDYRFSTERRTERFRFKRGLGIVTAPVSIPRIIPTIIQSSAERAQIDNQMWALDQKWLGSGTFRSMRSCVRVTNLGSPVQIDPYVPGQCKNWSGGNVGSTCDWGFWTIDKCDVDTASSLIFQYPRYLWAQSRMRDLLASVPRQGEATAQQAADWLWLAAQYVSALLWSTNVRFDNPNAQALQYAADLKSAGILYEPPAPSYDGPALAHASISIVHGGAPIRVMNALGYTRIAPTRQSDFFPGSGALPFMVRGSTQQPRYAFIVPGGISPYYSTNPIGVSEEQAEQIRQAAYAYETGTSDTDARRWASTRAFNDFWFRATWSWDTNWRPLADVVTNMRRIVSGSTPAGSTVEEWGTTPKTIMLGGAKLHIDQMVSMLQHYSDPSLTILDWMQQAMQTYSVDTSGIGPSSPAAIDFLRARSDLLQQVSSAAQFAATNTTPGGGAGGEAALYTQIGISLFQSILSLVGSSVPLIGTLYNLLTSAMNQLLAAGAAAVGGTPCPAFPFIRVLAPTGGCDLSQSDIVSSILSIRSNATWPVSLIGRYLMFTIDNKSFRVDFGPEDTTPDAVANRINASAALAGIRSVPANVSNSQVVVSGTDPGYGPPVATSGNATALGFTISGGAVPRFVYHPGLITTSVSFAPLLRQPPPARDDSAPQSSGGGLFVALAIALGIGGYAYSRRKRSPDNLSSEE